jgi:ABC-type cobalt transport system, ATPase component
MINIKDVSYSYYSDEKNTILNKISLDIKRGEFISILGPNGSGKSTLAKQLNAILLPSSGTIEIDGMKTSDETKLFKIRDKVGLVFQNPDNQIIGTNVEENVAFGMECRNIDSEKIQKNVKNKLETAGLLSMAKKDIPELSGGQKQKVAIISVLADNSENIILDEPTAMLDPLARKSVIQTLYELNQKEHVTVILITHNTDEVINSDRIVLVDQGQIVKQGTPESIFKDISLLHNLNLNVPQVTELGFKLKQAGLPLKNPILSKEELIFELDDLKKKGFHIANR